MNATADADLTRAAALADAYAAQVARWAHAAGADDAAAAVAGAAARAVSLATADGHVCIALEELPLTAAADAQSLRTLLLASGTVATAAEAAAPVPRMLPMVLDDAGRLYLHRHFEHERQLAARLVAAARTQPADAPSEAAAVAPASTAPDWQRVAVELALRRALTVISGGPGTGKTSTVVQLLARLIERSPQNRIALVAPTGKAAARMSAALRERAAALPDEVRIRLPDSASTVHRLLGLAHGRVRHDAQHPLPIDTLVVDEASMLDLALARRLFDAVPPHARIVLLGDKDQLSAVESGAVFAVLSADPSLSAGCRQALAAACGTSPEAMAPPATAKHTPPGLTDSVVWLTRNYRFAADSAIGRWAERVRSGAAPPEARTGADTAAGDVEWLADEARADDENIRRRALAGYAALRAALDLPEPDAAAVLAAYERFRVLCATRRGPRGTEALNRWLENTLRDALPGADDASPWYLGRPIMVLRNDALQQLYNGDTGIVLPDPNAPDGRRIVFPAPDGGFRSVAPLRLPAHETAYALTVHKAQGSEYDEVLLLLPEAPQRVLSRELLYTGLTRARRRLAIVGSAGVVGAAIAAPTLRRSGLAARLAEAAPATPN